MAAGKLVIYMLNIICSAASNVKKVLFIILSISIIPFKECLAYLQGLFVVLVSVDLQGLISDD